MTTQRNYWLNRTTKQVVWDASTGAMHRQFSTDFPTDTGVPASNAAWIFAPDLSAVTGEDSKYWDITGENVTLVDQATRDAIDAQELEDELEAVVSQLDTQKDIIRGLALELNQRLNQAAQRLNGILAAAEGANNLAAFKTSMNAISDQPTQTPAELRQEVKDRLRT